MMADEQPVDHKDDDQYMRPKDEPPMSYGDAGRYLLGLKFRGHERAAVERLTRNEPEALPQTMFEAFRDIARFTDSYFSTLPSDTLQMFVSLLEAGTYVYGTTNIAEAPVVEKEFNPVDETDRVLEAAAHGNMPKVCPMCLANPPAFFEPTGTTLRLYICSSCLGARLRARILLSPRELALRRLVDAHRIVVGKIAYLNIIPIHCWECGGPVQGSRWGTGSPRCGRKLTARDRVMCEACECKYCPDTGMCSFCRTVQNSTMVLLPEIGRRACVFCVRHLFGKLGREACDQLRDDRSKRAQMCPTHNTKFTEVCSQCEHIAKRDKRAEKVAKREAARVARLQAAQQQRALKVQRQGNKKNPVLVAGPVIVRPAAAAVPPQTQNRSGKRSRQSDDEEEEDEDTNNSDRSDNSE